MSETAKDLMNTTTVKQITLKPCPFCGSERLIHNFEGRAHSIIVLICIACRDCGARGPYLDTLRGKCVSAEDVARMWNLRAKVVKP